MLTTARRVGVWSSLRLQAPTSESPHPVAHGSLHLPPSRPRPRPSRPGHPPRARRAIDRAHARTHARSLACPPLPHLVPRPSTPATAVFYRLQSRATSLTGKQWSEKADARGVGGEQQLLLPPALPPATRPSGAPSSAQDGATLGSSVQPADLRESDSKPTTHRAP